MCQVEHYTPEDDEGNVKAGTPDAIRHVGQLLAKSPEFEVYQNPGEPETICLHRIGVRAPIAEVPVATVESAPAPRPRGRRRAESDE